MENPYENKGLIELSELLDKVENALSICDIKLAELKIKATLKASEKEKLSEQKKKKMEALQSAINSEKLNTRKIFKRKAKKTEEDGFNSKLKLKKKEIDQVKTEINNLNLEKARIKLGKKLILQAIKNK